jgi:hypothetical protein
MHTIVIGGTPELRMILELTKDSPQKRTVPQTARSAFARVCDGEVVLMPVRGGLRYQKPLGMATVANALTKGLVRLNGSDTLGILSP